MWFVFPQLARLGRSSTARFYGINGRNEARRISRTSAPGGPPPRSRRDDPVLGWQAQPQQILGAIDAMKLRSSLTLFDAMQPGDLFERALECFSNSPDEHTLALLDGAE